ncbi:MAG: hypothetical protein IKO49_01685 [Bacilli bacterium]|nr:hypothetical protein [Clostridia bacterium]MBR4618003.1 hypothetical protein [Bacilli bacterium]
MKKRKKLLHRLWNDCYIYTISKYSLPTVKYYYGEAVGTVASFNWLKHYLLKSTIVGSSPTAINLFYLFSP